MSDQPAAPDLRDGSVYVSTDRIDLAVRVALATGRPLLVGGDPGAGKSSIAPYVAAQRGWRYYEHVVTSRTQARDLLWTFDPVRQLSRAHHPDVGLLNDTAEYVEPGPLWWALAPGSARRRGSDTAATPDAVDPFPELNGSRSRDHAVVLIDEIDKADPDLPNGLLVPLGSREFVVTETRAHIRAERPLDSGDPSDGLSRHLVIITTNRERELPDAFMRRCVVLWLPTPGRSRLLRIAQAHLERSGSTATDADMGLADELALQLVRARLEAEREGLRPPSTAEYLDALRACRDLGITVGSEEWAWVRRLTLQKPQLAEVEDGD